MGVDTNLYLNPRWSLGDIKKVIERITGEKVKVDSESKISVGFFHFNLPKMRRQISIFVNSDIPTGSATHLSLRADDESHKLLKDIAHVLGGIFEESDCSGSCEFINGNITDGNHLAYFLKYAIVDDGIEPDDLAGFLKSMNKWYDKINPSHKPSGLASIVKGL